MFDAVSLEVLGWAQTSVPNSYNLYLNNSFNSYLLFSCVTESFLFISINWIKSNSGIYIIAYIIDVSFRNGEFLEFPYQNYNYSFSSSYTYIPSNICWKGTWDYLNRKSMDFVLILCMKFWLSRRFMSLSTLPTNFVITFLFEKKNFLSPLFIHLFPIIASVVPVIQQKNSFHSFGKSNV